METEAQPTQRVLHLNPLVLYFPPPLNRIITNILKLHNTSKDYYVAYKVKTTRPNRYCVRPNLGLIAPGETIELQIHYSFQKDPPTSLRSKDKFQVESVILTNTLGPDQSLPDLFKTTPKEKITKEKLKCRFASPTPTVNERVVKERALDGTKDAGDANKTDTTPKELTAVKEPKQSSDSKVTQELLRVSKERDALKKEVRDLHSQVTNVASFSSLLSSNSIVALLVAILVGYLMGSVQLFSLALLVFVALLVLIITRIVRK